MKHYTRPELLDKLKAMCALSSQNAVAAELGLWPSLLSEVLNGKRIFSDEIIARMGYEPVERTWTKRSKS